MTTPDASGSPRLQHYIDSMGAVPHAIESMFAMDTAFAEHYTDIRELIYADREGGLSLAHKELLLVMFDLAVSQVEGGKNHLAAARRAGLTKAELNDALLIAFLVLGVSGWGKVGCHLWDAWTDWEAAENNTKDES